MMVVLLLATSFWSASLLCLHFRHTSIEPSLMAATAAAAVSSERVNYSHRSLTEADGNNSSRRRRRVFFADTAQPSSCRTRQKKQAETIYRFSCCVCCVSSLGAHTTVIVSPLLLLFFRSNSSTAKNVVVHWGWGCCRQTVHSVQSNTLQLLLKREKG